MACACVLTVLQLRDGRVSLDPVQVLQPPATASHPFLSPQHHADLLVEAVSSRCGWHPGCGRHSSIRGGKADVRNCQCCRTTAVFVAAWCNSCMRGKLARPAGQAANSSALLQVVARLYDPLDRCLSDPTVLAASPAFAMTQAPYLQLTCAASNCCLVSVAHTSIHRATLCRSGCWS